MMEIQFVIAENLKRLRAERNLSLGQLAKCSGVSKVMLSQIEKGETNPTINTIWKIAIGLNVSYTSLLERLNQDATVIKKSEASMQSADDGHYRIYCYFTNTPRRSFELFQLELDAGHSYTSIGHSEKSQEYIMVLDGQLSLTVGDQTYVLNANDAISFAASTEHRYASSGSTALKASIINYYPA